MARFLIKLHTTYMVYLGLYANSVRLIAADLVQYLLLGLAGGLKCAFHVRSPSR